MSTDVAVFFMVAFFRDVITRFDIVFRFKVLIYKTQDGYPRGSGCCRPYQHHRSQGRRGSSKQGQLAVLPPVSTSEYHFCFYISLQDNSLGNLKEF